MVENFSQGILGPWGIKIVLNYLSVVKLFYGPDIDPFPGTNIENGSPFHKKIMYTLG
jgi:hypothetical protein